jgi:hypothetical protein
VVSLHFEVPHVQLRTGARGIVKKLEEPPRVPTNRHETFMTLIQRGLGICGACFIVCHTLLIATYDILRCVVGDISIYYV